MNKFPREKDISGCSIFGVVNTDGEKISGSVITDAISVMHDRANGLGGGFAGYGIYPDYPDDYAFHLFFDSIKAKEDTEDLLNKNFLIEYDEKIRTDNTINLPKASTRQPSRVCAFGITSFQLNLKDRGEYSMNA